METMKMYVYTVQYVEDGKIVNGLPFVALSDDFAKQMVHNTLVKDEKADKAFKGYSIVKHACFIPDGNKAITALKNAPLVICEVGELFEEPNENIIEKDSDVNE